MIYAVIGFATAAAVALAVTIVVLATRDLGRHAADPLTARQVPNEIAHEKPLPDFWPTPPSDLDGGPTVSGPQGATGVNALPVQPRPRPGRQTPLDMTPPPPAAATSRPHTHGTGESQGTRPGAPQGDAGPEGAELPAATSPAPLTWTTQDHHAAEIWATRPWDDDTGSFAAIVGVM